MKPIPFEQATVSMGKGQPQYIPLPVAVVEITPAEICPACGGFEPQECGGCNGKGVIAPAWREYTCRYGLTDMEIAQIIQTKSLFFTQAGFGFNPISASIENRFKVIFIDYIITEGLVECWVPLADKSEAHLVAPDPISMIELICASYPNLQPENIGFRERTTLGVDESGNITEL